MSERKNGRARWRSGKKAPPPRWVETNPVKAVPTTTRHMEVEELKKENERIQSET